MDNKISNLTWDVNPVPKPRMTQRDKWLNPARKPVVQYRIFKKTLEAFSLRDKYVVTNPLSLIFVMPMPSSWSNKKRLTMNGKPHQVKPDIDNMLKAVFDVLCPQGDQSIHSVVAKKIWGEEGKIIFIDDDNEQKSGD